jgi:hypothetical protein
MIHPGSVDESLGNNKELVQKCAFATPVFYERYYDFLGRTGFGLKEIWRWSGVTKELFQERKW